MTPDAIEHSNLVAQGVHMISDLLHIISQTHGSKTTMASSTTGSGDQASSQPTFASSAMPNQIKCILNMATVFMGRVIGKGGQRICDMMEEIGARIRIDQNSMGLNERQTVYLSGQWKSIESAV